MEKLTDWNALWRELVAVKDKNHKRKRGAGSHPDVWADRAHGFKENVKKRWAKPDSSREFILSHIDGNSTVLDIGAGTGDWAILLASRAKQVTAIEPSNSMIEVIRESIAAENATNISIVQGLWPDVTVEKHDFSLCSHAVYSCPDLTSFVKKMSDCTRKKCFLLLRAIDTNGIRAEAAKHIWGQPLDSPNFTIAYNILLQAGIFANVQMENTGFWKPRTSASLELALSDMRRFMDLENSTEHDEYLLSLLSRRLELKDGSYCWPRDVRSALVYWEP
jgi:2-polyprenyl-3-methyl-5-hydroxy-6-metoxy-1,4-benzoquinol methylase